MGIIIEFPDVAITILGVLKVVLPDENADVLRLQVNFIGRVEPANSLLWFYAELYDSRILFLTIEGGMGLLVNWGDDANFVFSVGGFHPKYDPPALPFPTPPRIAVNILNESAARIRIEGYFAVTSNSVQFGARAELYFGFSALNVDGHLGFDVLFQFNPFYFIFEFSAGLSVKVFGFGLFSISVSGLLEGPSKWHIKGKAKWKITWLGPTIKINIDETWGEEKQSTLPPITIFPLIEREFATLSNWQAIVPTGSNLMVSLRKLDAPQASSAEEETEGSTPLVLHPVGKLRVSQRKLPLSFTLEKLGNQTVADVNRLSVSARIKNGAILDTPMVQDKFATGEFKALDNSRKLSSPGFELYDSGIDIKTDGDQLQTSMAVKRIIRYETVIIDNQFKRKRFRFFQSLVVSFAGLTARLFQHFIQGSVVTQSTLSASYRKRAQPNVATVTLQPQGYSVANVRDNTLYATPDGSLTTFASQALAEDYLQRQLVNNPQLSTEVHIIPNPEVFQSAAA